MKPTARKKKGWTFFRLKMFLKSDHLAALYHRDATGSLVTSSQMSSMYPCGIHLLLAMAACGYADALKIVLADPKSILYISAKGFENLLKVLLKCDIVQDIDMKDEDGYTALMHASQNGYESCVQALLNAGVNIEATANDGMTALVCASKDGHELCVRALLAAGADKEAKNNDGQTALIYASRNGYESILWALLDADADTGAKDNNGHTALMYASENGHEPCVRVLLESVLYRYTSRQNL